MYSAVLIAHIIISVLLAVISCYIVFRSFLGILGKCQFSTFQDIKFPIIAVVLLYMELILGMILYAIFLNKLESLITQENASVYFSARFWALEHTILMIFAIIFAHLGLVYAKNLSNEKKKFKKNFLYFGISFILIVVSISMNIFRNG